MVRLAGATTEHERPGHGLRLGLLAALVLVLAAAPRTVQAHLVTSGAGPFFDGVAHFFVSPDDLLVVVAGALASGLAGKLAARKLVVLLPVAWLAGTFVGIQFAEQLSGRDWVTGVTLMGVGLLLGIHPQAPPGAFVLIAIVVGVIHGALNGAAMSATDTSALASLGIVVAVGIMTLVLSATAVSLSAPWQKIVVRVIGSWVAAVGLLMLAWQFRPPS